MRRVCISITILNRQICLRKAHNHSQPKRSCSFSCWNFVIKIWTMKDLWKVLNEVCDALQKIINDVNVFWQWREISARRGLNFSFSLWEMFSMSRTWKGMNAKKTNVPAMCADSETWYRRQHAAAIEVFLWHHKISGFRKKFLWDGSYSCWPVWNQKFSLHVHPSSCLQW